MDKIVLWILIINGAVFSFNFWFNFVEVDSANQGLYIGLGMISWILLNNLKK